MSVFAQAAGKAYTCHGGQRLLLHLNWMHTGAEKTRQSAEVDVVKVEPAVHEALLTSQAGMKLTLTDQVRLHHSSARFCNHIVTLQ